MTSVSLQSNECIGVWWPVSWPVCLNYLLPCVFELFVDLFIDLFNCRCRAMSGSGCASSRWSRTWWRSARRWTRRGRCAGSTTSCSSNSTWVATFVIVDTFSNRNLNVKRLLGYHGSKQRLCVESNTQDLRENTVGKCQVLRCVLRLREKFSRCPVLFTQHLPSCFNWLTFEGCSVFYPNCPSAWGEGSINGAAVSLVEWVGGWGWSGWGRVW